MLRLLGGGSARRSRCREFVSGRHRSMAGGWSRKMGVEGRWMLEEAFVGVEGLLLNGMKMD